MKVGRIGGCAGVAASIFAATGTVVAQGGEDPGEHPEREVTPDKVAARASMVRGSTLSPPLNLDWKLDVKLDLGDSIALSSCRSDDVIAPTSPTVQHSSRFRTDPRLDFDLVFLGAFQETQPEGQPTAGAASTSHGDLAKKLQNPVANLISIPFQFNWDTGIGEKSADKLLLNIEPVIPFSLNDDWNLISRTIIPVVYAESPADGIGSDFGMGDIVQSFFFSPKESVGGWIIGVGPIMQLPTGTGEQFRSEQFSLGPTALILQQNEGWTYGMLASHLWHVVGWNDGENENLTLLQPFLAHTWKSGTTLSLNTESSYDWTAGEWTVPINLAVAQLVHFGKRPVQFEIGGRWYTDQPPGGPEWGLRFQVTFLFPTG